MRLSLVKQSFFGPPAIWPPCDKGELCCRLTFCSSIDEEYVKRELLFHVNTLSEKSKTIMIKKNIS